MSNFDTAIGWEGVWQLSTDGDVGSDFADFTRIQDVSPPAITVATTSLTAGESGRLPVTENHPTSVDYGTGTITAVYSPTDRAIAIARANVNNGTKHVLRQTIEFKSISYVFQWDVYITGYTPSAGFGEAYTVEIAYAVIPTLEPFVVGLPPILMANSGTDSSITLNDWFSGRTDLTYTVGDLSVATNGISAKPTVAAATSVLSVVSAASGDGETAVPITATDTDGRTATATLTITVS